MLDANVHPMLAHDDTTMSDDDDALEWDYYESLEPLGSLEDLGMEDAPWVPFPSQLLHPRPRRRHLLRPIPLPYLPDPYVSRSRAGGDSQPWHPGGPRESSLPTSYATHIARIINEMTGRTPPRPPLQDLTKKVLKVHVRKRTLCEPSCQLGGGPE